jgi:hypothetical protein
MSIFRADILNASTAIEEAGVGEQELERRRLALQHALSSCLTTEQMAHALRLCEQEFAEKMSLSVSELCQRLFETMPQLQLDKDARLRLLRAMRQPRQKLLAEAVMPTLEYSESLVCPEPQNISKPMPHTAAMEPVEFAEPMAFSEPMTMSSPEDSTSPELTLVMETPPMTFSPTDSTSPELFVLRYTNLGKNILG